MGEKEAKQAVMDIFIKKGKIAEEYYKEKGVGQIQSVARRKYCEWCERFKAHDYYNCLNCGSKLK